MDLAIAVGIFAVGALAMWVGWDMYKEGNQTKRQPQEPGPMRKQVSGRGNAWFLMLGGALMAVTGLGMLFYTLTGK